MYPDISAIISYAKSKKADRPLIMCEYSHAMGNSNGALAEYWQAIHSLPALQGGFIWEMWDHGLDQRLEDGTIRSAYGGDFGEAKHDGNFCCDGMFFPDRSPKPALNEFKYIASPIEIKAKNLKSGRFEIFNKNFFLNLSDYKLKYEVTVNGKASSSGEVKLGLVKPRQSKPFTLPAQVLKGDGSVGERFINFSLTLASSKPWAHIGHEVTWEQIALVSKPLPKVKSAKSKMQYVNSQGQIQVPFGQIAPALTLWRAPTDNDLIGHISQKWDEWGVRKLELESSKVVRTATNTKITNLWRAQGGAAIKHIQLVESVDSGIRVSETVTLPKELTDLARVGINFEVDGALNNFTYFGIGPNETAPDRKIGKVHRYSSTVDQQYVPYVKPQENGGHMGMRWFSLTNQSGHGLYFQLDKPRMVTVTPMRSEDLANATHNVFVNPCGNTVITIDGAHRGIGTASCGPDTLAKYLIKPGTYKWSWSVVTF
jgi:beta-galactosidase